jgi:hypothetical protein
MASSAIPRDDAGRLSLLRHLNATLPGMADLLGLPADLLARLDQATASFGFALDYQTALKNAAEGAVALKVAVRDGPVTGALVVHPVTLPTPPAGPLFEGVYNFLVELIAFIKAQTRYTDAIGQTLNILPLKAAAVDLGGLQPVLSVRFVNDQPFLDWAKADMEALEFEADRGNGFTLHLRLPPRPPRHRPASVRRHDCAMALPCNLPFEGSASGAMERGVGRGGEGGLNLASAGSQAPALIVTHKSLREQQNPEGVQAISRGLSEATPPDGKPNKISTPEGSQSFRRSLRIRTV